MGKKAALTNEQKEQYAEVMQSLKAKGVIKDVGVTKDSTEPVTKRVKGKMTPKETAAKEEQPEPKAPKAKAKKHPKAKAKQPEPVAAEEEEACFFDDQLGIEISWKNFPAVLAKVRGSHPMETNDSCIEALKEALGPCPAALKTAVAEECVRVDELEKASKVDPGPIDDAIDGDETSCDEASGDELKKAPAQKPDPADEDTQVTQTHA